MDGGHHTVLQFITAAAQLVSTQEEEDSLKEDTESINDSPPPITDLGQSIYAIYPDVVLSQSSENEGELALVKSSSNGISNTSLKELLAEAAEGNIEIQNSRYEHGDDDMKPVDSRDTGSSSQQFRELSIPEKMQVIFKLPRAEEILGEWPCYIVRSVIVAGFLYLTEGHICFYASLPNNQHKIQKSGFLQVKAASKSKAFSRCYFELKNDVLSWYENATDTYCPMGKVDLKYALEIKHSKKREHGFRIVTMNRTWQLQADTKASMVEWINMLQRGVFKAKNNGPSLKIMLPFDKIFDVEKTDTFDFQQFIKVRAVGIDDNFTMDEFYFAYFSDINSTYEKIKSTWAINQQAHTRKHASIADSDRSNPRLTPAESSIASEDSSDVSPALSISDLYDNDVRAKTSSVQSTSASNIINAAASSTSAVTSAVANAFAIPSAIKGFLGGRSMSASTKSFDRESTQSPLGSAKDEDKFAISDGSSSEEEEAAMVDWLKDKRRSGLKLVYSLLGTSGSNVPETAGYSAGSAVADDWRSKQNYDPFLNSQDDDGIDTRARENFKKYFVLPESEELLAVYRCSFMKTLPCYGKLYISPNYICFNSRALATRAKFIVPLQDIATVQKLRSRGYFFYGLSILTHNKKELFLEFASMSKRNSCFARIFMLNRQNHSTDDPEELLDKTRTWEAKFTSEDRSQEIEHIVTPPQLAGRPFLQSSIHDQTFDVPDASMHFTCLTIGTRGDVQPYIALCKGLMARGHRCRIATHDEYKEWIEEHNIEFCSVGGDPGELMRLCVDNGFFTMNFVREGLKLFKGWFEDLLSSSWLACQGTDVLIESPSAMIGVHMAEKLGIPYFRAFPMPWTRTRSFPHPFATPNSPKGRLYNDMTYVLIDHVMWRGTSTQINNFRRQTLQLPATTYEKLQMWRVPFLYCFSPSIVPSPLDWMDWVHCTGYWFLDRPQTNWEPEAALLKFLNNENDKRPIIYIGFGSIIVPDPDEVTRTITEAVMKADVRAVVSKGWSSRMQDKAQGLETNEASIQDRKSQDETLQVHNEFPDTIYWVKSVPHDWLFPMMSGVVHHGGAGTTAAGLRAGIPTVVKPFFGDQFFWGERLEEMNIGLCLKEMSVESLSSAVKTIITDESMKKTARLVGEKIRAENGINTAIQCIYRDLEVARQRTISSTQAHMQDDPLSSPQDDQEWLLVDPSSPNSISSSHPSLKPE
ncbi:unnamed protein product [Umbelopsis ramanniana]